AEAKAHAGPFAEAGDFFAAHRDAVSQLKAARAYEHAKDPNKARAACDRVLSTGGRTRAQEAQARALRFRLPEKPGADEIADARWLYVNAPDLDVGKDAVAAFPRLDPQHPLTAQEQMTRAKVLSEAGRLDEALRAVDDA